MPLFNPPTMDIVGLTAADLALDDSLPFYDLSATANRKLAMDRLLGYALINEGRLSLVNNGSLAIPAENYYPSNYLTPSSTDTTAETVTFPSAHGWISGTAVKPLSTVGGLTANTRYYVNVVSTTVVSFHTTIAGAIAGTGKVNLTASITSKIMAMQGLGTDTLYFYPTRLGDKVALFDATRWKLYTISAVTLLLTGLTPLAMYDVFLYDNAGALTLEAYEWDSSTVTITNASPGVVTWTGHSFQEGDAIFLTTSGGLPTGLSASTIYYVRDPVTNTFTLSATKMGTKINTSSAGSGTHTGRSLNYRSRALQNNVFVKAGNTARRLVGTFQAVETTATESHERARLCVSADNQIPQAGFINPGYNNNGATTVVSQTNTSWAQFNSGTDNSIKVISDGLTPYQAAAVGSSDVSAYVGVSEDNWTGATPIAIGRNIANAGMLASAGRVLTSGYHSIDLVCRGGAACDFQVDFLASGADFDNPSTYLSVTAWG